MKHRMAQGTVYLVLSQVIFMFASYGIHVMLGRRFGPELYGLYGVIISILVWVELAVITGISLGVTKYTAECQTSACSIIQSAFKLQLPLAFSLCFLLFLLAPFIARTFGDVRLGFYLKLCCFDIVLTATYALFLGMQLGLTRFDRYALIGISYFVGKLLFIYLLTSLGLSLSGAILGFMLGSLMGAGAGGFFYRRESYRGNSLDLKKLISFALPVIILSLNLNLLFSVDLWCVKYFLADRMVGYYQAATTIAKIPYFLSLGLSHTIFPLLSQSIALDRPELNRAYISQSMRLLLLLLMPVILLTISSCTELVSFLYSSAFLPASPILSWLIVAMCLLTFYNIFIAIFIADNRANLCLFVTLSLMILDWFLNIQLVPRWGTTGAAVSTTLVGLTGSIFLGILVWKRFKVLVSMRSVINVTLASGTIFAISLTYSTSGFKLIGNYVFLLLLYLGLLYLLREITQEDLRLFKTFFSKPTG